MPDTQNTVKNKRKPRSDKQGQTFFPNKKISSSRLRKTTAHKVQKTQKCIYRSSRKKLRKKFVYSEKRRTFAPDLRKTRKIPRSGAVGSSLGS